jgi:hypothetical protein
MRAAGAPEGSARAPIGVDLGCTTDIFLDVADMFRGEGDMPETVFRHYL